jgi:hypothetical protein
MDSRYKLWGLPFMPVVPYPLRAAKISLDINPFSIWWKPSFTRRTTLTEAAKCSGETIWWARWLWFQISYSRWV